ncbi:enhancer of split m4 protein [Episyrphus balteatus]|uniref:enhancer of split m4 protein n=1 Tax=Episyrphus balteatus TaxID=286459 RepID=UPI002486A524|nr:enhancer of split m4 protein [Episyrphus balteatus]
MCVEILNNDTNATMEYNKKLSGNNKKMSYSIKKMLKSIFNKQKSNQEKVNQDICKQSSMESLESMENDRNAEAEIESENEANERIYAASQCGSSICSEDQYDEVAAYVPVHFVRTTNGTFFWTATSSIPADADLIEPLCCSTDNQIAVSQFHDRWAQA